MRLLAERCVEPVSCSGVTMLTSHSIPVFNDLLSLDFPFVLTQSFSPLVKSVASERFTKKYKQMISSNDAGVSQAEELLESLGEQQEGKKRSERRESLVRLEDRECVPHWPEREVPG